MVMSMAVMLGAARDRRFSIPDRSGHLFRHDQLGEATAEGAQRRAADLETDLGDAEVATAQQRHRALDAPRRVCWSPARSCHAAPEVPIAAGVPPLRRPLWPGLL